MTWLGTRLQWTLKLENIFSLSLYSKMKLNPPKVEAAAANCQANVSETVFRFSSVRLRYSSQSEQLFQ